MVRKLARNGALAVVMILLLSFTGPAVRMSYAIASPPQAPPWLTPGDYIEYNQTYTIGGLMASINVKDTVLNVTNGAADMRIQLFGPQIPNGFPEPGLVAPSDSANDQNCGVIRTVNGTTTTSTGVC
ncbi:MAG: hypothetical protein ACRD6W_12520, partial [Nitrososphaerales archaeon]